MVPLLFWTPHPLRGAALSLARLARSLAHYNSFFQSSQQFDELQHAALAAVSVFARSFPAP